MHLAIFGAGYIGGALARQAVAAGWRVTALTRNSLTADALCASGCTVVIDELSEAGWWTDPALAGGADRIVVTVAGGGHGAEGYRRSYVDGLRSVAGWGRAVRRARDGKLGGLLYTSSTTVYPQDGGVTVTESDPIGGDAGSTCALIEAERLAAQWPGPATVLRLAGIYGPGRTHLVGQVRSGNVAGRAENHLNLIHRDDILSAIWAVWACEEEQTGENGEKRPVEIFNLADEGRATKGEVTSWLAGRLGVPPPRFTGRPAEGRRDVTPDRIIDAGRARAVLGWRPRYRNFREGYAEILDGEIQA